MKLSTLMEGLTYEIIQGDVHTDVKQLCWDSRRVKEGALFIAVRNKHVNRHDFIMDAVREGATSIILEDDMYEVPKEVTVLRVDHTRKTMAILANRFYHEPSKKLKLIGITGTNGKTSTSFLIDGIMDHIGKRSGLIGTIKNTVGPKRLKTVKINPTTPDALELQSSFAEMVEKGVEYAVMEVTSTALERDRVIGCDFNIGVFTNLSRDHLDEHGTMEAYQAAKAKLFSMCKKAVINIDDPVGEAFASRAQCPVITFGIMRHADFTAKDIQYTSRGSVFTLVHNDTESKVTLSIPGEFTIYNALAAIASCYALGLELDEIIGGIGQVMFIPGRFERIPNLKDIFTIVDYAHSPDSLEQLLQSAKKLSSGKIYVVFGCGGNRDKSKRPIMGKIAGMYADHCILTSDNPRDEDPVEIIRDIEVGIMGARCTYEKIEDRKKAIFQALSKASKGDIVIVAGKGHENYQIRKGLSIYFNDAEVIEDYFMMETDSVSVLK
ncbi:UDP-N-acetylmuramoyl-L-alanyl-D-glutamate--2,6-diaminopimelate ligase [Vallitalea pronyensis]|uniref:UDP-N-acetylmuramoyl-L-alanyl-D-glutamate--2,6-diaminopimelate ligase n=1 Tax=Vallitalea pronyensis TaxID=1348613 RepID=A0A8J8SI81_9FIRM|nr:UDP-N-acetylmuramoyl-L-alanyl-D-glutamate--2,6-diaminopimelate ligase [Vallitalea pronyensis]QUI24179.1 UDP-N-acetylmuramoyl-L-alanyl-D-glutamate--2,6-diaminopimelate ligase [Vallitalea pronyensis]